MSAPYYADESVTLYHGDCRELLGDLDGSFDALLTDPPYSSGGFQEAGKSGGSIGSRAAETIALDNLSTRGYERVMREVLRYCNQADEAYVFTDWRMWVYTFDALESAGWRVRNMLVWDKVSMGMGLPWRNQHELLAFGKRTPAKLLDGNRGNVLRAKRSGNPNHPTEKPVELLAQIVSNSAAETFLDPFAGAGSTLIAAKQVGRRAIGIEAEERFCEAAAARLAQRRPVRRCRMNGAPTGFRSHVRAEWGNARSAKPPATWRKTGASPTTPRRWPMGTLSPEPGTTANTPRRATSVYRYYDQAGFLIYVGITARGGARNRQHNGEKEWWPFVARQEVEHYDTRPQAARREKELIRAFRPPFNTVHNPGYQEVRDIYLAVAGVSATRPPHLTVKEVCVTTGRVLPLTPLGPQPDDATVSLATNLMHYHVAKALFLPDDPILAKNASGTVVGRVKGVALEGWTARVQLKVSKGLRQRHGSAALHVTSGRLRFRMVADNRARIEGLRVTQELGGAS